MKKKIFLSVFMALTILVTASGFFGNQGEACGDSIGVECMTGLICQGNVCRVDEGGLYQGYERNYVFQDGSTYPQYCCRETGDLTSGCYKDDYVNC